MPKKRELNWGETPFDRMKQSDLRMVAVRLFSALGSARSALAMSQALGPDSPYWGNDGTGGRALEKSDQALANVTKGFDEEEIYRCFFRYADDLLFDSSTFHIGSAWTVCPGCLVMVGDRSGKYVGKPCADFKFGKKGCDGVGRRLEWSDLAPMPETVDAE